MVFEWGKCAFYITYHEKIQLDYFPNYSTFLLAEVFQAQLIANKYVNVC